jgi:hypothetical protein
VRQYENSVADLLGSFTWNGAWDDKRGLKSEYYLKRSFRRDERKVERIDPAVDFDFGEETPVPEDEEKEDFSAKWFGGLFAPETGVYEFVVESPNGFRLWINDNDTALIDRWVRSGDDTEHRETIRLIGGRVYPIRLEFFKFKEPKAAMRLKWKPPHHAEEVIPERCLSPNNFNQVFVLNTPFPPDDRSTGFERGTSISKEWYEASTHAALEVAAHVADDLRSLCDWKREDSDEQRNEKLREFGRKFVEGAFRRPLSD